jgi:formate dehydrogenase major subunit
VTGLAAMTGLAAWPVWRQLTGTDCLGRGAAAKLPRSANLDARTAAADRVVKPVCPFCAIGCGQQRAGIHTHTQTGTEA